jgi:hypothetical protein
MITVIVALVQGVLVEVSAIVVLRQVSLFTSYLINFLYISILLKNLRLHLLLFLYSCNIILLFCC